MSCRYKDQCPSYSGWCNGPKQDFSKCVEFLITAYENEKKRMMPNEYQKKYQGHKLDPEHLEKELGDCLWMIAEACTALGWNMETVMQTNIEKLRARYPDGFDADHSLHRKANDI